MFFNENQLRHVEQCAQTIAEIDDDALGVSVLVNLSHCGLLTRAQLAIVSACALECRRQQRGPFAVVEMVSAISNGDAQTIAVISQYAAETR